MMEKCIAQEPYSLKGEHVVAASSVCPSVCPSVQSHFLPNPWTKLDETSYMNSLGYWTDVLFPDFQFDALSWIKAT